MDAFRRAYKSPPTPRKRAASRGAGGRIPAVGSRAQVAHGTAQHTVGGLVASDLLKVNGRYISRRKHLQGLDVANQIAPWQAAVARARDELGIQGFELIKGDLLDRARAIYAGRR